METDPLHSLTERQFTGTFGEGRETVAPDDQIEETHEALENGTRIRAIAAM